MKLWISSPGGRAAARSAILALAATVGACARGPEAPAEGGAATDDSMLVASEARVPSGDRPTVVFLGTSLTAGLGLERDEETYVSRLAEMADSAGKPIRAVNAGVSGETSAGGLRRLDWVLRERLDVLVLELGANDGLRGQDPLSMAENLTQIVRRTRNRYPEARVILAGMEAPPNLGEAYTGLFRDIFNEVAERENVELVPFLLEGVAGVPELNQDDRIHPTAEGHRRIARTVWPVLESVLDLLAEDAP
jgi:acyl-CoA thioesterase I